MSGAMLEILRTLLCMVLMGAAIKFMDDHLDAEYDICRGERTLAVRLGRATLPYAVLCGVIAVKLNGDAALSLFFGSYAVGMFSTWRERQPTRLPAYVEIAIAALLAVLLCGWRSAAWGFCLMAMVDWLDDLLDMNKDRVAGGRNMAVRFGVIETTLLILLSMSAAVVLNARWTAEGFVAFTVLTMLAELTTRRLWGADEEHQETDW